MNAARIKSFMERTAQSLGNHWHPTPSGGNAAQYRPPPSPTEAWNSGLPRLFGTTRSGTMRENNLSTSRLFLQAVLLFAACIVVAFHPLLYRHCCSRRTSSYRNPVSFFH